MSTEDLERCYVSALRILKFRFNSAAELKRKLRVKDFTDEIIEQTLERLRAEKWLDDARYASAFVRTRQNKRVGARRIARELGAAGVDRDVVKQALGDNADPERERADLLALAEKRYGLLERRKGAEYAASAEGRNKLTIYLLNQGYDSALVREIVKEILVNHR